MNEIETVFGPYTDDKAICELLKINQKTLNNKVCKGDSLPNFIKLPGSRSRLWPVSGVVCWLSESQEVTK
jgi:hypothetical protein